MARLFSPWQRGFLLSFFSAALAAGCGGGPDTLYPVHGTVYLDDRPATELAGGTVTFNSTELHRSASGEIQANGTYSLSSLRPDDGALAGKYQATVSPPEAAAEGERGGRRPVKGISFQGGNNLEVTVEPRTNDIPIHLRSGAAPRR